jgi:hypothetical protein
MGIIATKDNSWCGTCAYWGGQRSAWGQNQIDVDPTSMGRCQHPDNFPFNTQDKMATENSCPKFSMYPYLNN